jgi:dihydroneopterin aldolase
MLRIVKQNSFAFFLDKDNLSYLFYRPPMDHLSIANLSISTHIGIYNWEKKIKQTLLLDITIPIDCRACEDQIKNTLDYAVLCQDITEFLEANSFELIETVADKTAARIQEKFAVDALTLKVSKPGAVKNAGNISVTVHRGKITLQEK